MTVDVVDAVDAAGAVDDAEGFQARRLAHEFIAFLETGETSEGLFAPDVFFDVTVPQWRLQAEGREEAIALRLEQHPTPGRVARSRLDETRTGFVLDFV